MTKWEYFSIGLSRLKDGKEMTELGKDGWELVTIYQGVCVFKRALL